MSYSFAVEAIVQYMGKPRNKKKIPIILSMLHYPPPQKKKQKEKKNLLQGFSLVTDGSPFQGIESLCSLYFNSCIVDN